MFQKYFKTTPWISAMVSVTFCVTLSTSSFANAYDNSTGMQNGDYLVVAEAEKKDEKVKKEGEKKDVKTENCDSKTKKNGDCSTTESAAASDNAADNPEEDIEEGDVDEGNENTED